MADSTLKERRGQQRIRFEAPATITAGQHTLAAATRDISIRGLFLFTDMRLRVGSEIDILIVLPEEVRLAVSGMVRCHGRVIRDDATGGQYGTAVKLHRLEVVPQV